MPGSLTEVPRHSTRTGAWAGGRAVQPAYRAHHQAGASAQRQSGCGHEGCARRRTRDSTATLRRRARLRVSAAARRAAVAVAGGLPPSLLALQDLGATLMIMTETMTIGTLARQADVNPRTLRYYERIGLLVPSGRTDAGYRLYTARDAARLAFIRRAQALGLTLTEIADIIAIREAGTAPCRHVRALGGNEAAARLSAIPVARLKLLVYMLSGALSGVYRIVTRRAELDAYAAEVGGSLGWTKGGSPSREVEGMVNLPVAHGRAALRRGWLQRLGEIAATN